MAGHKLLLVFTNYEYTLHLSYLNLRLRGSRFPRQKLSGGLYASDTALDPRAV